MEAWKPFYLVIKVEAHEDTIHLSCALSSIDSLLLTIIKGEYHD